MSEDHKKIKIRHFNIRTLHSSSKSSFCWKKFGNLMMDIEGKQRFVLTDQVFCLVCLDAAKEKNSDDFFGSAKIKAYSSKVSTGNLIRHLKDDHQLSEPETKKTTEQLQQNLKTFFNVNRRNHRSSSHIAPLNKPTKWVLGRDLALWFCRSLMPFDSVSDIAMIDFLKKYNVILTEEDLPTRTTISRSALDDVYTSMFSYVKNIISWSITRHAAITTDLWSDSYKRQQYITMTLHYVNNLFKLESLTLVTQLMEGSKTAAKIRDFVEETLRKFELHEKHMFLVTDAGANVKKAAVLLSENMICESHLCLGHALHNLVVVDGIKSVDSINELTIQCKKIVKTLRFKLPELQVLADEEQRRILFNIEEAGEVIENDEISTVGDEEDDPTDQADNLPKSVVSLKNATPTRWHSILIMLESLYNKYNQVPINQLLETTGKSELKISESQWNLMKQLIIFLGKFRDCVTIMSAQKNCTINVAMIFRMEIADILDTLDDTESLEVFRMKKNMKLKLNHRFPVSKLIVAATLLDCRFQGIKDIDNYLESNNETRVSFLSTFVKDMVKETDVSKPNTSSDTDSSAVPLLGNASQSLLLQLSMKHSAVGNGSSTEGNEEIENECWKYFASCSPQDLKSGEVLQYWNERKLNFPWLSSLAKAILCVPATSTPSERVFSVAGLTLTAKRSRLSPMRMDKIIFIHDNYQRCKDVINDNNV